MPEQVGRRSLPVTAAPFPAPFETGVVRCGQGGVTLLDDADASKGDCRRMTNLFHEGGGSLTLVPGLVRHTGEAGTLHHTIARLNDVDSNLYLYVLGVDTSLYTGTDTLTEVDDGYSGDPLTLVPYRPPLSGETWMFVADRDRLRKVRTDGLDLPIGLPAPSTQAAATVQPAQQTAICAFDATDGSDAATWTGIAGYDYQRAVDQEGPQPTGVPVAGDGGGVDGNTVELKTVPGGVEDAARGYWSAWAHPLALNLAVVGTVAASDDDYLHTWVKFSHPDKTAEFRVYFVVSETFAAGVLPGTSETGANGDFYMKSWRTNDFSQALAAIQAMVDAAETARVHTIRDEDLRKRKIRDDRASFTQKPERDPARARTLQTGAGRETWVEYGVVGVPLRRGDFQRFGSTAGRDWATVTGMVIYLQTTDGTGGEVAVSLDDMYLFGGSGPDSGEPGDQPYDYRYTYYDPRTGAEGNPSPEMTVTVDALRQAVSVTGTAPDDDAVQLRWYRRGASLFADWYYLGVVDSGDPFLDTIPDEEASTAGTLELDNDAAVTSITASGDPIYGQPCPVIFGPVEDLLFLLGDPLRPGDVYYCKPGQPDAWPSANHTEVCAPSEELMNGGVYAGQAFVLSRERGYYLYPSLTAAATSVTATPSACKKGLVARWGIAIGRGGIFFVGEDAVYRTTGGPEESISEKIRPLFRGETVEGYRPIDFSVPEAIRLSLHGWDLHFFFQDVDGVRQRWVYSILYNYWRHRAATPGVEVVAGYSEEGGTANLHLLGARTLGVTFREAGSTDDDQAIPWEWRSNDEDFGRPREDKLLGDLILDAAPNGTTITATTRLNGGALVNTSQTIDGTTRARFTFDPFLAEPTALVNPIGPQKARTLSVTLTGTSAAPPTLYQVGVSIIPQPDVTLNRVTQWDDFGHAAEVYLTGLLIDVDTGNGTKEFYVEYDLGGEFLLLGPYTVTANNRHKYFFSWAAVKANLVRIRPIGDCAPWMLYRAEWIFDPEPPRIARWDINHEQEWDQYLTGFDLECNTFGATKTVELYVDQVLVQTYAVSALGRRVVHLTVQPPLRGHVLRFVATDDAPGLLYAHRWHTDPEPSEQTNWNQNYTVGGALSDKWLKAILFECDTFGEAKSVEVQIDGAVVETLTVVAEGRSVVELAFPQHRGRVFRVLPVDPFPGRLYTLQWVFDQEPLALSRWETQEITHGLGGWQIVYGASVCYRSEVPVLLTVDTHNQAGGVTRRTYDLPATAGVKIKRFVPFEATKGVLFKYLFTAQQAFWLYREETEVKVAPWGYNTTITVKPFGNDDLDSTRGMTNASLAAGRNGGGS